MASRTMDLPAANPAPTPRRARPLWRTGVIAAVVAAAAAAAVALVADAIDVPLEVDDEEIPISGFVFMTVLWSAVGVGLAHAFARWAKRPARTFVVTAVVLTLLSFGPVVAADAETATQVTLALAHVAVAAIVIPAVAFSLPRRRDVQSAEGVARSRRTR